MIYNQMRRKEGVRSMFVSESGSVLQSADVTDVPHFHHEVSRYTLLFARCCDYWLFSRESSCRIC